MIPFDPERPLDVLVEKLFDYAGMFPPAARSFERALEESVALPTSLERPWILANDLVLDTKHARLLLSAVKHGNSGFTRPIRLTLLASESAASVCELALELAEATSSCPTPIVVASIEVKCSLGECSASISLFRSCCSKVGALLGIEPDLSVEPWREALLEAAHAARAEARPLALKCRCTGPTGIGAARLAQAMAEACDAGIPFKVTGGFHHPIVEPAKHEYPMGFLNLAAAVMLRRSLAHGAPLATLERLLTNASPTAISFTKGLVFESLGISLDELRRVKHSQPFSIGSCSLGEPDADLHRLYDRQQGPSAAFSQ